MLQTGRSSAPIFIIGAPRSGTSVTNWAIGQHPNIQVMPETAWIASYVTGAFSSFNKGSERGKFSHLSNVDFPRDRYLHHIAHSIDAIIHEAYEMRCQRLYGDYKAEGIGVNAGNKNPGYQVRRSSDDPKSRWIDATPLNTQFTWALAQVFPNARFIHNLRDPVSVASSLEHFDRVGAQSQALSSGLETWIQHTDNAWLTEKAFGASRVFRLEFERLEREPAIVLREALHFLEEDWCEDCLEPLATRTNSSEVEDSGSKAIKRLSFIRNYKKARSLYEELLSGRIADEECGSSELELERRFDRHLTQRPLL